MQGRILSQDRKKRKCSHEKLKHELILKNGQEKTGSQNLVRCKQSGNMYSSKREQHVDSPGNAVA